MVISKNEENIEEIINEFDEMVGMEDIKNQLAMFFNAVEINQKEYKAAKQKTPLYES